MDCQGVALALQDLSTSIQEIASPPSNFVLHRTQCLCLAKSYAAAVRHVTQQLNSTCLDSQKHQDLFPSLSELHHAMLQGRTFLRDCLLQDGWVKKALILALTTEAQDVCLHDLVWCLCVIHRAMGLQLALQDDTQGDNIYGTLNDIWADASHEEDLRVLLDALESQIAGWKLLLLDNGSPRKGINAQCCLAEFLWQRLAREKEIAILGKLPHYLRVDPLEITIKELIGGGSYAAVHEVEWHGEVFGHKEFLQYMDGEEVDVRGAAIQARLSHPNVLQLICWTSKPSRKTCGLVMELMERDLKAMIDDRKMRGFDSPFSLLTSVDLMLQIAKGMEYLHSLYIMHRDLKSSNLLVTNKFPMQKSFTDSPMQLRLKIAGFSTSKAKYQSSQYTTLNVGTSCWRAPEVWESEFEDQATTKYTKKADVYSFAMVCYEILSGNIPFDNVRRRTELRQTLLKGERPKLPSSCPPYLASYIEKCWQGDPEKRPSFDQISRTFRHLKGILLSCTNPLTSSLALSTRGLSLIEEKLKSDIGVNWLSTAPKGITTKLMTISFEMYWYRVMEGKLTKEEITKVEITKVEITKVEKSSDMLQRRWLLGCWPLRSRHTQRARKGVGNPERKSKSAKGWCMKPCSVYDSDEEEGSGERWAQVESYYEGRRKPVAEVFGENYCPSVVLKRWKERKLEEGTFQTGYNRELEKSSLKRYTYGELALATNQFATTVYTRAGGYGNVFKGRLADGELVAVKVMSTQSSWSESFLTELKLLRSIRHRNVVPLLGFCSHEGLLNMLVYKYMSRGDLGHVLHKQSQSTELLTWAHRYRIALGVASALFYLHHGREDPIVHRDVKPGNILLDDDFAAYLSDFGIATFLADYEDTDADTVMGTRGYIAPEYFMTLQLGLEADVYSFGVVLLELATGRSVAGRLDLVQYVWDLYEKGRLLDAVDARLRALECHDDDEDEMNRLLLVGLSCCQSNRRDRPSMHVVVQILSKGAEAPTPAHPWA